MKVLITGSQGFIARNLSQRLSERNDVEVICFDRSNDPNELAFKLKGVDVIFHLAGVNRPHDPDEFITGNRNLTEMLCDAVCATSAAENRPVSLVFASSIQAEKDNDYGRSKLAAEDAVFTAAKEKNVSSYVFRLPNVFGKWCRPNYNSAVATFCHNIARGLPVQVHDSSAPLSLVYVDDVVESFISIMDGIETAISANGFACITPQYSSTVGEVVELIQRFKESRQSLTTERVGTGFIRALYSTYVSYLPVDLFHYKLQQHVDVRGSFVEMLKTQDSGQFSYFTAHPGVTRGGHYHHSKTEKFLVIKGKARFLFRHIQTGEKHEIFTDGECAEVVETVPGWTHDITNIGDDEMIVMLWANEIFDRSHPDTYACPV
ncbi:capsular biosynthesis protein [Legionella quinlivanii]|uniref:Capsular biosynthesis protein n=1 Tax=Legionella quinlivanii TaxID=45073 RepID=A0A364LL52_9GAMM|nr:NAD-dependent epimerase/dehydratase family protein [Legionella quinlivanii]RAP37455.1 capsular biosynthesis protein [Legionella quinlivanii]